MDNGHRFAMCLRRAYLAMRRRTHSEFARFGVTSEQFVVLTLLVEREGVTQKDLVERSSSDPNTMAAILRLLEERGYVTRERHPKDGRARCVFLTEEGRETQSRLRKCSESLRNEIWETLEPGDRKVVMKSLAGIASKLSRSGNTEFAAVDAEIAAL